MDMEQKIWKHKTFEVLTVEFVSNYMSLWKFKRVYLTNQEFLQDFKNRAGDKLKLLKQESLVGIGGDGTSVHDQKVITKT